MSGKVVPFPVRGTPAWAANLRGQIEELTERLRGLRGELDEMMAGRKS